MGKLRERSLRLESLEDRFLLAVVAGGEEMTPLVVAAQARGIEVYETGADTALAVLSPIIAEGDVILFKGSNGSGVWRVADALLGKES